MADASSGAGIALDKDRNIYLTDPQLNRMRVFNSDGKMLYEFGESGTGTGQLWQNFVVLWLSVMSRGLVKVAEPPEQVVRRN
ncbi:MAG TPA: hypothetical protein VFA89_12240 [Terriglobales bacterium]|nr:hypothetical protein [Terriglobales bacterium]